MAMVQHDLQGDLRAGDAEGLRAALLMALQAGDLRIGTADVVSADTAILQVLLSARQSARQLDRVLEIDLPPDGALARLLPRLALEGAFAA